MSQPEFWDETWSVPARTIDMLGRQQIANIPTALHELFKNAHDAYADHVVADFFRAAGIMVIRDDGDGMTAEQLRRGWLTLASAAKHGANQRSPDAVIGATSPRTIMGEKGIGRLAIASIGPQVLIMTRARSRDGSVEPLYVSLVHWGVNQLPDVDLSRVVVPTMKLAGNDLPDADAVASLSERLARNVEGMRTTSNDADVTEILRQVRAFRVDPSRDMASLPGPTLARGGNGTHFVIQPTDDTLVADLTRPSDDEMSQVEKYLLGFSNTMMPDHPPPAIVATFNDHRDQGPPTVPIGSEGFFTPADFAKSDHSIEGEFDHRGHFRGCISVYGKPPRDHEIAWRTATAGDSRCGPFRITFAYLQGKVSDTLLPADEWLLMSSKLNRMGGLYVYRDGIRILPYGGPDQDFVGIERRRTKSANDWFFSYRRIFGAVELTHRGNFKLREKAGREGFIKDGAYNDFVGILSNFFERLAIDFFRESSKHGDWYEVRERLNKQAELLAKRNRSAKAKGARFSQNLDKFFADLEVGAFGKEADDIRRRLDERLGRLPEDVEAAGAAILRIEADLRKETDALAARLVVTKPRGMGLTKARASDWDAYQRNVARLRTEVITPIGRDAARRVDTVVQAKGLRIDRRRRLAAAIDDKGARVVAEAEKARITVGERLEALRAEVAGSIREAVAGLNAKVEGTRIDLLSTSTQGLDDTALEGLRAGFEQEIDTSARDTRSMLSGLADQLESLMRAVRAGGTLDETTDALETQSHAYREQLDQYVELAQLGTAVGIVQHEFASAVGRVRRAIERLDWWARSNPELSELDRDLRAGFEHIDTYLDLFAPLSKRLSRSRLKISGREIRNYLDEVFGDRLERHGVRVTTSAGFDGANLDGQPSAVLAAFVNLMDNAIHWVCTAPAGTREIRLDRDGDGLSIANTGPGIEVRDADRIFEFGETSRPGGRGDGSVRIARSPEEVGARTDARGRGIIPASKVRGRPEATR